MKKELLSDYSVFPDKALVVEVFKGTVIPNSITNMKTIESKDPKFSLKFDLLSDFRNTFFDTVLANVAKFYEFVTENNISYETTRKNAVLIATKNQQVYIDLFNNIKGSQGLTIKSFYDIDEAFVWLGRQDEQVFIEDEIKRMLDYPKIKWILEAEY